MSIDLKTYEAAVAPPRQVLFDYFQDVNVGEALLLYLFQRGWQVTRLPTDIHAEMVKTK